MAESLYEYPPMKSIPPSPSAVREAQRLAGELCDIATGEREACWSSYGSPTPLHSASDRLTAITARLAAIAVLLRDQWVPDDAPTVEDELRKAMGIA